MALLPPPRGPLGWMASSRPRSSPALFSSERTAFLRCTSGESQGWEKEPGAELQSELIRTAVARKDLPEAQCLNAALFCEGISAHFSGRLSGFSFVLRLVKYRRMPN